MVKGYEKIVDVKSKLKTPMTVSALARAVGRGERTIFRYLEQLEKENCGLRRTRRDGETYYVLQTVEETNFNQEVVKRLEKIRKNMPESNPSDVKNRKLMDKLIELFQVTNPDEFKPEAVTLDPDYILDYGPFTDHKLQDSMVNRALQAIHDGFKIRINYTHSATEGEDLKSFEVSPVKIVLRVDTVYLIAAEDSTAEIPVFKNYLFENITNITLTSNPIPSGLKERFDARAHYKYTFGKYTSLDTPQKVALLVKSKWLQTQFEKSRFNPEITYTYDRNKNMMVNMDIRVTPDFKSWLMGVLPDVQIVKPESLKKEMKELLKKTLEEM